MKIALVCRAFTTQRPGGMLFVCEDRARALAKLGHEVTVFTTRQETTAPVVRIDVDPEHDKHFTVVHLPCQSREWTAKFGDELRRAIEQYKPEILHIDSLDRSCLWWTEFRGRMKVTCTIHGFGYGSHLSHWNLHKIGAGPEPKYSPREMLAEMRAMALFDLVIATSLCEHWYMLDTYSLNNTALVYNPIHERYFTKPHVPHRLGRSRFLCAAVTGGGFRQFDKAAAVARRIGAELVVAEKLNRDQMVDLVDSCSCTVVPTCYAQGYDMTVAEAIARRRRVIAAATGSYLREAQAGVPIETFPVGDWSALEKLMAQPRFAEEQPHNTSYRHHPDFYVTEWLAAHEAIGV